MPCALVQKDLTIPAVEKLKAAFRASGILTDMDAVTLAGDAYGILTKNLSREIANTLQADLHRTGVETVVIDERELPVLPAAKFVHRLDCTAEALMIYDPLGRAFPLAWGHILMLAAGSVRLTEFTSVHGPRPIIPHTPHGAGNMVPTPEFSTREARNHHLLLEIILSRAVLRYSVTADTFNFEYLGSRRAITMPENFKLLVQDLVANAPQAVLNRGVQVIREGAAEILAYPTKNAFYEEIIWHLWRITAGKSS